MFSYISLSTISVYTPFSKRAQVPPSWTDNVAVKYTYQINKQCFGELTCMKVLSQHIQRFMTTIISYCDTENLQNKFLLGQDGGGHESKKKLCIVFLRATAGTAKRFPKVVSFVLFLFFFRHERVQSAFSSIRRIDYTA